MAFTTYLESPYFDDYKENGVAEKGYLRMLFRPGRSVQVRELNQMQSMIQDQIDRFGSSLYKDGSPVIDGTTTFDPNLFSVTITLTGALADNPSYLSQLTSIEQINGSNTNVLRADVLKYENVGTNQYKFYIRYSSSQQSPAGVNVSEFILGNIATSVAIVDGVPPTLVPGAGAGANIGTVDSIGYAAGVFVKAGVFFIKGTFVLAEQDSYFFDINQNEKVSGYAAWEVREDIVTDVEDINLLDNATGEPNYSASGAHRYAIALNLTFVENGTAAPVVDVVKLLNVDNNVVISPARTAYSQLDRVLAQRTDEESGSYTVTPFQLDLRETFNDGTNRGKYTHDQLVDTDYFDPAPSLDMDAWAEGRFNVGLEQGIAYVDGFRVAPQGKQEAIVQKARTLADIEGVILSATIGNYFECASTGVTGFDTILDHNVTHDLKDGASATIGTVQIRSIERTGLTGVREWRVYVYNLKLDVGKTSADIVSIALSGALGTSNGSIAVGAFTLIDSSTNSAVFPLPYDTVESMLVDGGNDPIVTYRTRLVFADKAVTSTMTSPGVYVNTVTLPAPSGSIFYNDSATEYVVHGHNVSTVYIPTGAALVTLTLETTSNITYNVDVIASVRYTGVQAKAKSLETAINEATVLNDDVAGNVTLSKGNVIELANTDIKAITAITLGGVNIIDKVTLDNGQRDAFYQNGRVIYTSNTPTVVSSGGAGSGTVTALVSYTYYAHSGSAPYFSADSYPAGSFDYGDIPSYNGVRLCDALDFRPYIGAAGTLHVDPNSIIETAVSFYLPRRDLVTIDRVGKLNVIQGDPSLRPVEPKTPDDALTLYTLDVPAYTFAASDIKINYVDNKRYTMRDIGALEGRIKNLEYYTSLSLLEKDAEAKQILESDGANRYKNGIVVDAFIGHSVGDVTNPAYKCAVERAKGTLRPSYESNNMRFKLKEGLGSTTANITAGKAALLDYTEVPLISQPFASDSISVNPYDVAIWNGTIELSPPTDEWKSVTRRPDVITNIEGNNDAMVLLLNEAGVIGTEWNEWTTNWSSSTMSISGRHAAFNAATGINQQSITTTTTANRSRTGILTSLGFSEMKQSIGDSVVDLSFVPFVRSRKVYFKAEGLKPNTRVYAFFDGEDVSSYVDGNAAFTLFTDRTDVTEYEGQTSVAHNPLITDSSGRVEGSFIIPNNDELRFRTGTRHFKLTDSAINNTETENTTAETDYFAQGLLETRQNNIISTRVPEVDRRRVDETRTTTTSKIQWVDPLAQSFIIGNIASGVFASKVDLFFAAKPFVIDGDGVPVSMHIVTVENGQPTQKVVPFSRVVKYPSEVSTTNATTFTFETPIYLAPGVEYAIVLISNSADYRAWISRVGGTDVATQKTIAKNPYAGVFFTSQNASTWTADQSADLKFTIYRADFESSGVAEFETLMPDGVTDFDMSAFNNFIQDVIPSNTSISYVLNIAGTSYNVVPSNNYSLPATVNITSGSVFKLIANYATSDSKVSPVIDLERASILCINNIINDDVTNETTQDGGSAQARYITREVALNNPADQLNIYLAVNKPSDVTGVTVYGKFKIDDTAFSEIDWIEIAPNKVIPINSNPTQFADVEYELTRPDDEFTSFAIKIVMTSSNAALVPMIKDLRAIATL